MNSKMIKRIVKVTQEDINEGTAGSSCECPVALALDLVFNDMGCDIYVEQNSCELQFLDGSVAEYSNEQIREFIKKFDNGEPVEPFEFTFESEIEFPESDDYEDDVNSL